MSLQVIYIFCPAGLELDNLCTASPVCSDGVVPTTSRTIPYCSTPATAEHNSLLRLTTPGIAVHDGPTAHRLHDKLPPFHLPLHDGLTSPATTAVHDIITQAVHGGVVQDRQASEAVPTICDRVTTSDNNRLFRWPGVTAIIEAYEKHMEGM